jgi:hypothetical protein
VGNFLVSDGKLAQWELSKLLTQPDSLLTTKKSSIMNHMNNLRVEVDSSRFGCREELLHTQDYMAHEHNTSQLRRLKTAFVVLCWQHRSSTSESSASGILDDISKELGNIIRLGSRSTSKDKSKEQAETGSKQSYYYTLVSLAEAETLRRAWQVSVITTS